MVLRPRLAGGSIRTVVKVGATYELTDALKLSLAYVHFGVGDDDEMGPFMGLQNHDQVLTKLRWSFTAL